jgi:hypothetical protein
MTDKDRERRDEAPEPEAKKAKDETDDSYGLEVSFWVWSDEIEKIIDKDDEGALVGLIASSKRKRVEVVERRLSEDEKKQFHDAKMKEATTFLKAKAVAQVLKKGIDKSKILPLRWVLTWKVDESAPKGQNAKARLVCVGFHDPDCDKVRSESPTQSRQARSVQLQVGLCEGHHVAKGDISAAFLKVMHSTESSTVNLQRI